MAFAAVRAEVSAALLFARFLICKTKSTSFTKTEKAKFVIFTKPPDDKFDFQSNVFQQGVAYRQAF